MRKCIVVALVIVVGIELICRIIFLVHNTGDRKMPSLSGRS